MKKNKEQNGNYRNKKLQYPKLRSESLDLTTDYTGEKDNQRIKMQDRRKYSE